MLIQPNTTAQMIMTFATSFLPTLIPELSSRMAAARAEARRKAILARGTDRLAKLTTSARGEEGGGHLHDGV